MSVHTEVHFETEICEHLAGQGWLYAKGDAAKYDSGRALFQDDLVAWVKETQPKAWESLTSSHGDRRGRCTGRPCQKGTRQSRHPRRPSPRGGDGRAQEPPITLAQFRPALAGNAEIEARYAANRLRVVRQLKYSLHNENCIDLVLFLNGLPVATVELKTDFTQSVDDAVDQYRFDRLPRPKGQAAEPLLDFPRGALVHFAVSNESVKMTTRLEGPQTRFLPFDRGSDGGAGNPPHPSGHRTAYLWEEVWARDSWLEIIGRYLVAKRNDKKQIESIIFPRYHQLDATRALQAAVLKEGAGGRYLVQHSAGSGKTNSIAWTAHFLADLHDAKNAKMFDTVVVVSDRTVIDSQLREAIFDFERTTGVVATITGESGSKSGELAEALNGTKKVVVCTIQTFPKALEKVQELAATEGKRFAVIADEAHSSQAGEAAAKLRQVLSVAEREELSDGGEISTEDLLAAGMAAKATTKGSPTSHSPPRRSPRRSSCSEPVRIRKKTRDPTTCRRLSTPTRCARLSRRGSSSTCCRTTRPTDMTVIEAPSIGTSSWPCKSWSDQMPSSFLAVRCARCRP